MAIVNSLQYLPADPLNIPFIHTAEREGGGGREGGRGREEGRGGGGEREGGRDGGREGTEGGREGGVEGERERERERVRAMESCSFNSLTLSCVSPAR